MKETKTRPPQWETLVLAASFPLLWAWFVSWQSSLRLPGGHLSRIWWLALVVDLLVLVWITVRRMLRVRAAFYDADRQLRPPTLPHVNGRPH